MQTRRNLPILTALCASVAAGVMSGCSGSLAPSPVELNERPVGNLQGAVHGGQAPVSGAHIYLYAAGRGGYGTRATSLIRPASDVFEDGDGHYYVVTDSGGNFALSGDDTCTEGQQVFMVAVGGKPGLTGIVNNTPIVQMAGLGQCPAARNLAAQVPDLVINEATTVAFAHAMSGFGTTAFNIASNATPLAANGFSTSAQSGTGSVVLGIDGSGNVWTGNADGSVTQLLGLATPTAAPFYGGETVATGTERNQTTTTQNGNLRSKP
jgi:hypothetical protein